MVNLKRNDVTDWTTNNYNSHIAQYLKTYWQPGQLIEYNMRNIFLENPYTKCGEEVSHRTFYKSQNWTYLWINSLKCYKVCFYCMSK